MILNVNSLAACLQKEWHIRGNMNQQENQKVGFTLFGLDQDIVVAGIAFNQVRDVRYLKK